MTEARLQKSLSPQFECVFQKRKFFKFSSLFLGVSTKNFGIFEKFLASLSRSAPPVPVNIGAGAARVWCYGTAAPPVPTSSYR